MSTPMRVGQQQLLPGRASLGSGLCRVGLEDFLAGAASGAGKELSFLSARTSPGWGVGASGCPWVCAGEPSRVSWRSVSSLQGEADRCHCSRFGEPKPHSPDSGGLTIWRCRAWCPVLLKRALRWHVPRGMGALCSSVWRCPILGQTRWLVSVLGWTPTWRDAPPTASARELTRVRSWRLVATLVRVPGVLGCWGVHTGPLVKREGAAPFPESPAPPHALCPPSSSSSPASVFTVSSLPPNISRTGQGPQLSRAECCTVPRWDGQPSSPAEGLSLHTARSGRPRPQAAP